MLKQQISLSVVNAIREVSKSGPYIPLFQYLETVRPFVTIPLSNRSQQY